VRQLFNGDFMDEIDALIAELVDAGALLIDGMLLDEFTYRFDMKILKEKYPDIYDIIMEDIDDTMLELLDREYISVEYDENLEARFSLTEKGYDNYKIIKESQSDE
jgi:hypothetical protein